MKVLSLFDGMACGALALLAAEIKIDSYDAFEIDKYAVQTSTHNFPFINHHGDVFHADFSQFKGVDLLCGGSPCTYWSIAQKSNRETEASGMGWELFQQYVRALREAKPKYFIYENNKSMSKAIRQSIDEAFGFEAVLINSALVSAQNRQRLYWVGKLNDDGTYSKVNVEQPKDRGIVLRDVLESYDPVCVAQRGRYNELLKVEQHFEARQDGKTNTLTTVQKDNYICEPIRVGTMPQNNGVLKDNQATRIYSICGKGVTQSANGGGWGAKTGLYAVPICHTIPQEVTVRKYKVDCDLLCEMLRDFKAASNFTNKEIADSLNVPLTKVEHWFRRDSSFAIPDADVWFELKKLLGVEETCFDEAITTFEVKDGVFEKGNRAYDVNGKMSTVMTGKTDNVVMPIGCYAVPIEFDGEDPIKAISGADNKEYTVYKVKNGLIAINGKEYPIKLADGYYIIRNLTVTECKRLQTVPDSYVFPVSETQAKKMLGNGWTVEVIAHILSFIKELEDMQ